jgi:N-acetylmuramic acid 6-phosphate etherase
VPAESDRDLFDTIAKLTTEARNPRSTDLDRMDVPAILELINDEDVRVAEAVRGELPHVAAAVELVLEAFRRGGRLLYVGAGTSGRLGVLDAAECPPTFGSDPSLVRGIIAGGEGALVRAVEGAEDDAAAGARAIADAGVGAADVVCGIAASRRTPFVRSAVAAARAAGAKTVYITMNPRSSLDVKVDVAVCPVVGPEVLMGSTRMNSGLAPKMVLTMITTAAFVRMGPTCENMMVDLMATSAKLRERGKRVVMTVTGVAYERAAELLRDAGGSVKVAVVMEKAGVDAVEARRRLDAAGGFVREAVEKGTHHAD